MKIYVNKSQYGWQTRAINGEDKLYIDVGFKKGEEPNKEFCLVEIKNGFFSMYKTKTGLAKIKLVIMEYNVIENKEEQYKQIEQEGKQMDSYSSSDLPF